MSRTVRLVADKHIAQILSQLPSDTEGMDTMAGSVVNNIGQVTAEWLTAVLRGSRALAHGTVTAIEGEPDQGNWSSNGTLCLRYSPDAAGERPPRLFLKMVDTDLGDGEFFGPSEVDYYTRDYEDVPDAPLLRCYDGRFSASQQRYHLLLQDVSPTHVEAAERVPTLDYGLALAEGLAALHARWWGAERLAEAQAPIHGADHIRRFVAIAEPGVEHILGRFADQLRPQGPALLRDLFARHPQALIVRTQDANGFTLIHGDVGHNNVLVPRNGQRPIYIIDRQPFDWSLTTWLGVYDLAYAMVLDWPTDLQRRWEIPILKHYHAQLIGRGVRDYSWEQLYDDYRLCVAMGVYIATEYCRGGVNERRAHVWLPMLQRALAACDDLNCRALWHEVETKSAAS